MPILPLTTYAEVRAYAEVDMRQSAKALVRVSHVHLFGISIIFLLTGGIFTFSAIPPGWRALIVALPFLAIWVDIGSWWFTRFEPIFAYTVIAGGALMGLSLAVQIGIPLWEMWRGIDEKGGEDVE